MTYVPAKFEVATANGLGDALLVLLLYAHVNSYGHGGTVCSPYHTFS